MISPGDVHLFRYVETAEEAWAVLPRNTASTCPRPPPAPSPTTPEAARMDQKKQVSLIGAPTDIGAGSAARAWGRRRCASRRSCRCWSRTASRCSTAATSPARPTLAAAGGRLPPPRRGGGLEPRGARGGARRAEGRAAHPARRRPLPGPSARSARWRAIAREAGKKLRVLWLDAHADFNTSELTPSGNIHGMPVACLCGHGPKDWSRSAARCRRSTRVAVRQIGIRSVDPGEKRFVHQVGLEVFDMRYIDEMGMRTPWSWRWPRWTRTRTCTSASTSTSSTPRSRRASAPRCRAADLPRGAAVHGDDRRHRAVWPAWT